MPPTSNFATSFFLLTVLLVILPTGTFAFGAGDIPDFAYLNDKAFRHGDIENILENLVKNVGGAAIGGESLLGFATSVLKAATGGSKFSKSDVKKVYFGNWLRDYSQAMDIAGLSKLSADTIVLILSVLGFMTFGFATEEFEVTQDRLGVYLPVEHIDNPKGYAEKEGDARQFHPKLRPPVDQRELEVDPRTGMKNYMATENQGWDTSTSFIRRTLKACIEQGRRAGGREGAELWEAYRLLGTGLHTLEDLLAHSNWCEIALRKMGHREIFCHVGDNVIVNTPNGPAPPLVTGTFGGADFLHSLLGEAGDKLSQASVTDLSSKMNQASQGGDSNVDAFKTVLGKLPIGGNEDKMSQSEEMHKQSQAYNFDPNNVAPPEVQRQLMDLLRWRDGVMREIIKKIEMVPGLSELVDEFTNALNAYVYTILAPYVVPMITEVSGVLDEGSKAVINNLDQYQVFDDPNASDPSHSLLSKDHFGLILNEPAGKIAQVVVEHTVGLIVQAWSDGSDPDAVLDRVLEAFHHPYYSNGNSGIQRQMFQRMEMWLGGLGSDESRQIIQALTKESVRAHKNKRIGSEDMNFEEPGYGSCGHGTPSYRPPTLQSHQQSNTYSGGQKTNTYGGGGRTEYGEAKRYETHSYGSQEPVSGGYQSGRRRHDDESQSYGGGGGGGGGYEQAGGYSGDGYKQQGYGSRRDDNNESYGSAHKQESKQSYGSRRNDNNESYGSAYGQETSQSYGGVYSQTSGQSYDGSQGSNQAYGGGYSREEYGSKHQENEGYGRQKRDDGENRGYGGSHGQEPYSSAYSQPSYGSTRRDDDEGPTRHSGRDDDNSSYGGGYTRQKESETGQLGYGRSEEYGGHSGGGGHSRRKSDDEDGDSRRPQQTTGYTPSYDQNKDSGRGHHSRRKEDDDDSRSGSKYKSSGYAPSYQSGETYGAERLKIRDDDSDGSKEEKKRHGRHRRNDSD